MNNSAKFVEICRLKGTESFVMILQINTNQ